MKKTLKFLIFGTLPFLIILIFIFFINIIKHDSIYAHKSMYTYQNPFNWFEYKIKSNIVKSFINFRDIYRKGLEKKRIYLEEQKQKQLLTDTPRSTKIWQRGFYFDEKKSLLPMQARLRGDNPRNWLFEKKNWRIKVRKKDIVNQQRYFDYLPFDFNKYFSGKIANKIGVLSSDFRLIELYLNDKSQGVYIEHENFNESFLRRKKIMPVNMYKTEQILDESIIALESNFFNSPGVASKSAVFNQLKKEDKSDLIFFLELMRMSSNDKKYFDYLIEGIGVDKWALFASYQILTQNFHNDNTHNLRMIVDPWSGHFYPIAHDPLIGNLNFEQFNLDNSSNDLLLLLNQSSKFQELKLKKLYQVLNSEIIEDLIDEHKKIEKTLSISETRDVEFLIENFNFVGLIKTLTNQKYINNKGKEERLNFLDTYTEYLNALNLYLISKPEGSWKKNKNGFEISVKKDLPLSDLKIYFEEETPEWIYLDLNENNKLDEIEKNYKFYPNSNYFSIPYNFYANRLDFRKTITHQSHINLKTPNTRFKFITNNSIKPQKIEFKNFISKKKYFLKEKNFESVPVTKFNIPISTNKVKKELIKLSGIYEIKKSKIFYENVLIEPGTTFNLHKNKSLIFKGKVIAEGEKDLPIVFQKAKDENWGTIALQGPNTSGSSFDNIILNGGTGHNIKNIKTKNDVYYSIGNIRYISALSLHDVNNIKLKNIKILNNSKYDDALHIIYSNNIFLENIKIHNSFGDAIDIDMSREIFLKNIDIKESKNDAVDLMESSVVIEDSNLFGSKDKAISVGENSLLTVRNSSLINNDVGIATKDGSSTIIDNLKFENNKFHIKNYKKNWRYGDGGLTIVNDSEFDVVENDNDNYIDLNYEKIEIDKFSSLLIENSSYEGKIINQKFFSKINEEKHLKRLKKLN